MYIYIGNIFEEILQGTFLCVRLGASNGKQLEFVFAYDYRIIFTVEAGIRDSIKVHSGFK